MMHNFAIAITLLGVLVSPLAKASIYISDYRIQLCRFDVKHKICAEYNFSNWPNLKGAERLFDNCLQPEYINILNMFCDSIAGTYGLKYMKRYYRKCESVWRYKLITEDERVTNYKRLRCTTLEK